MSIDTFLSRVKGVKKTGPRTWMCRCPSHDDRTSSLSVRQAEDERILINCFAGCSAVEVVGAIGLTVNDLFESALYHRAKPLRPGIYPRDVLKALRTEFMIVMISAFDLRKGKALNAVDMSRLDLAYERFANAVELAEIE